MERGALNRLIVISNRVSPPTGDGPGNQGGLAVALSAALRESSGIWFGWSGEETEAFTGHINFQRSYGVTTATVDLEAQDVEEYYNGYANCTLWPLFHNRVDLAEFERGFAGGYERVNDRLAETVAPLIEESDLVWVHDYHLMLLGRNLRTRGVKNRIGFFLHIPWPPARLLESLPGHGELFDAMLDYDVIGFQSENWRESFIRYVQTHTDATIDQDGTITLGERRTRIVVCPIGIDFAEFHEAANGQTAREFYERMQRSANGRTMIVGVDRLDYSKGLPERFLGYERLLASRPDLHGQLFLLQIAPPSREQVRTYQQIRATLDSLSGRINGEFADAEWVPLRYINKGYPRDALAGIYRASRIGLITPLCDGMNLVAKEYVAAQDPDDPGVLILSQFAGAARQLTDALIVNPYSPDELAEAIDRALQMDLKERRDRWRSMMESIRNEDVRWWQACFTKALAGGQHEPLPEDRPQVS